MTVITRNTITDRDWVGRLGADGYRLRRSWPRSADHLLVEVVDDQQRRIAGQWFADPERAASVAARTPGSRRIGTVVLQPGGADRKLASLASLTSTPGHRLIAHRPERRAVVRTAAGFVKVLPPVKLSRPVTMARAAESLGVGAPRVLEADFTRGRLTTAALPGAPLTELLTADTALPACGRVGELLARLHGVPIDRLAGSGLAEHGPEQERAVLARWSTHVAEHRLFTPELTPAPTDSGLRVPVHRDFHDGQLLLDDESIGVLDFDLMAIGDPALDLANFLAQLELRAAQGVLADPEAAGQAFLEGYRPDPAVQSAIDGYLSVARARLRAVYAFRNPEYVT
jgi:tRNA A-37 threonylcarbamoyl transferase component Bud32